MTISDIKQNESDEQIDYKHKKFQLFQFSIHNYTLIEHSPMGLPINQNDKTQNKQGADVANQQKDINKNNGEKELTKGTGQGQVRDFEISTTKSFHVLNFTFASQKVLVDFLLYSCLVILIPIILVFSTYNYVKENPSYSQLDKIVISVGPSLLIINIVIGIYIYKVIKDPENYKKDAPIKPVIPVGLKEQNMNRRMDAKKKLLKQSEKESKEDQTIKEQKKPKNQ